MLVPSSRPTHPHPPRLTSPVAGTLLLGGLAALLVGLPLATSVLATRTPAPPPCELGLDLSALAPHARAIVARRQLACGDVTHGRISKQAYQQQIAEIDRAWRTTVAPPAVTQWASSVRGVSSQYSESSWSAAKLLGAPDVYPQHGDLANAWASRGADDADEWVEVGFAQPMHAGAVEIYETFNPGAISAIELITASGARVAAQVPATTGEGAANRLVTELGCTAEPIVAVHVKLASTQVAGWNELDAIGLVPCAER